MKSHKSLFVLDGLGALFSAFMLGIVLVKFQHIVGIPVKTLYLLAVVPCFFAAYDLLCYLFAKKNTSLLLRVIAFANIAYCILSIGLAISHSEVITIWGWIYIIGEVLIVLMLAWYELKVANQ